MDKVNKNANAWSHHSVERPKAQARKGAKEMKVAKEAMPKTASHKSKLKSLINRAQKATGKTKEIGKKVELCAAHALKKK